MIDNLGRKLVLGFGLGFAVLIGLVLYADIRQVSRLLQDFRWSLLPAILGLTLLNYFLRGVRFHYYLRQIGLKNISLWTSLRVFIGGFSLTLTPGKVGELIRVIWLKNLTGASPALTAPSTVVDRIAGNDHDPVSQALWQAHVERALMSARKFRAGWPSPRLALRGFIRLAG